MKKYAIIAGTGFDNFAENSRELSVETEFGNVKLTEIKKENYIVYFLPRHGRNHNVAPHKINYRAHIKALKQLGVSHIFGICAVGSLKKEYNTSTLIINDDFLDMTKNRTISFFEEGTVKHLDVSEPYNRALNSLFMSHLKKYNLTCYKGIYVCTEGPRFESATEIRMYQMLNCDVVGMTNIPEVLLANEMNIVYSCVSYITNYCTGMIENISEDTFTKDGINKNDIINAIFDTFNDSNIESIESKTILL